MALYDRVLAHPGKASLSFRCRKGENGTAQSVVLMPSDLFTVELNEAFITAVERLLGGPRYEILANRELPKARRKFAPRAG